MTPGAWRALPQACARQGRQLLPRGRPLLRLPRPCRRQRPRRGCPCSARRAARSSAAPGSARACASPSPRRVRIFRLPSCLQRPYSSQSTTAVTDASTPPPTPRWTRITTFVICAALHACQAASLPHSRRLPGSPWLPSRKQAVLAKHTAARAYVHQTYPNRTNVRHIVFTQYKHVQRLPTAVTSLLQAASQSWGVGAQKRSRRRACPPTQHARWLARTCRRPAQTSSSTSMQTRPPPSPHGPWAPPRRPTARRRLTSWPAGRGALGHLQGCPGAPCWARLQTRKAVACLAAAPRRPRQA